ncbi:hypothetical protein [Xylanibacillus composti]|nr:hypothetical protein [Xylanibacillus composti]
MKLEQIAAGLKEYELFCYRTAYYLLEQEHAATIAAQEALAELGGNRIFFEQQPRERKAWVRKAALKHALKIYAESLAERRI